jgi:hypothetical protein
VRPPRDEDITINVCLDPVDFRMGINGLSVLIESSLKYDPSYCRSWECYPGGATGTAGTGACVATLSTSTLPAIN